eukprot:TRINITY_DN16057_c1_g3_i1.p2 TRINITY_DN16057_c1_g3~~TRINITY_DN16057_c1_g3_i1.p2  ORF type:complete len:171 (-),score=11.37 TRINITY_DN16057_c1_g3_i1:185-697(-)
MASLRYRTSGAEYGGRQRAASVGAIDMRLGACSETPAAVPTVAEVLASRPHVRRPFTAASVNDAVPRSKTSFEERDERVPEPVPYAHVMPRMFPGKRQQSRCDRVGAANPLYTTASSGYGSEAPQDHQLAEFWFPRSHDFCNSFTDPAPRDTGLHTAVSRSRVHASLDPL